MIASLAQSILPYVGMVIGGVFTISYALSNWRNGGSQSKIDVESTISKAVQALEAQLAVTERQRDDGRQQLDAANLEIGRLRGHLEKVETEFAALRKLVGGQTVPDALKEYLNDGWTVIRAEVSASADAINARMDSFEALLKEALNA